LECGFEFPAKIPATNRKRPSAPGLARRSRGGAEPPAVGQHKLSFRKRKDFRMGRITITRIILLISIILIALIIMDYLPLHDIYRDYISVNAIDYLGIKILSNIPEWTSAELEWSAITFNYIFKIILASVNIALVILLLRANKRDNK
jgi:hypothetical protein